MFSNVFDLKQFGSLFGNSYPDVCFNQMKREKLTGRQIPDVEVRLRRQVLPVRIRKLNKTAQLRQRGRVSVPKS